MSNPTENVSKPLLSMRDFYAALGGAYGLNNLYGAAASGRLKTIKIGRKVLVPHTEIEAFIKRESGQ